MNKYPEIILGTVQLGIDYGISNTKGKPATEEAIEILTVAYQNGICCLDTAEGYGNSQHIIGLFHKKFPACRFNIITKLSAKSLQGRSIIDLINSDLNEMHIDCLEGYMFHNYKDFEEFNFIHKDLTALKTKGVIKKIGVSVYTNEEAIKVLDSGLTDFIQVPYNLLDNDYQRREVFEKAASSKIKVHTRSVFLQGLFYMEHQHIPEKLKPLIPYLQKIKEMAEEAGISIQEMAMLYVRSNPLIEACLLGVANVEQLHENVKFSNGTLNPGILERINAIRVFEKNLLNPNNWN